MTFSTSKAKLISSHSKLIYKEIIEEKKHPKEKKSLLPISINNGCQICAYFNARN
jgi:hypothetical protein